MQDRFETFTVLIDKVKRCIRRIKTEEMSEYNLKSPHVSCLYYLYRHKDEPLTAKELSEICDEDKASVSRSVEFLEENGYLMGGKVGTKRYKTPLVLTEKGVAVARSIVDKIDNVLAVSSDGMTDEERGLMYKGLAIVAENLQRICDKYGEQNT